MAKRFGIPVAIVMLIASAAEQSEAQIGIVAEQGSSRSLTSQAVSLTTLNGAPGFISATTQRPFVTGLIPVVGDYGGAFAPIYGPLRFVPQHPPGPSVIRQRIAQIQREGLPPPPSRAERREIAAAVKGTAQTANSFTSRLARARRSSAGRRSESIAEIRRRQQREHAGQGSLRK